MGSSLDQAGPRSSLHFLVATLSKEKKTGGIDFNDACNFTKYIQNIISTGNQYKTEKF